MGIAVSPWARPLDFAGLSGIMILLLGERSAGYLRPQKSFCLAKSKWFLKSGEPKVPLVLLTEFDSIKLEIR